MPDARWCYLGRVSYAGGIAIQERLASARAERRCPDTLLLLEHPPTVTLGRHACERDVVWSAEEFARRGIPLVRVGRGGGATYHGPGQLVGYPIVAVAHAGRGVRRFIESLEEILLDVAATFGVAAERHSGFPGIWVGDEKLASIGIEIHRGVSRHGFAINVNMDLAPFSGIAPCGMAGLLMTDLSRAAGSPVSLENAVAAAVRAWRERFGEIAEENANEFRCGGG